MTKKKKNNHPKPIQVVINSPFYTFVRGAIFSILAISFFIPFFSFDFFYHTHRFTKIILYFGAIEIIGALFLLLWIKYRMSWRSIVQEHNEKKTNKRNWPLISVGSYLFVTGLSVLSSIDPFQAFWGTMGWANGFLTIAHFSALFAVIITVFPERFLWKWFLRIHLFSCLLMAGLAIWQQLENAIPFASFGNTGYLAGYLLFGFFEAIVLFLWEKEWDSRVYPIAVAATIAYVISFVTDIRSAQVGIVAGILSGFALWLLASRQRVVRRVSTVVISVLVLAGISASAYFIGSGKAVQFFERSVTVQTRLTAWKIGLEGFWDRPILGYGQENYPVVFEKYFDPGFYEIQSPNEVPMEYTFYQPHNKFVEVAVVGGIVGLIAYLGVFFAFIYHLFRRYQSNRDIRFLALSGMFVGYGANLFFHFDTATTFFAYFFALGLAYVFLSTPDNEEALVSNKLIPSQWSDSARYALVLVLIIGYGGVVWLFVIQPWKDNRTIFNALVKVGKTINSRELDELIAQVKTRPSALQDESILEVLRSGIETLADKETYSEGEKEQLRKLVDLGEYAYAHKSNYFLIAAFTGRVSNYAGRFDPSYYERTVKICLEAIRRGTKRQEVFFVLADGYAGQKNREKAVEYINKGIELDSGFGLAYTFAARTYLLLDDRVSALKSLQEGFHQGLVDEASYNLSLEKSREEGDYDKAVEASKYLVKLKPADPQALANLAMVYYEKGDYEESVQTLELFQKHFPAQAKAADQLLNQTRAKLKK